MNEYPLLRYHDVNNQIGTIRLEKEMADKISKMIHEGIEFKILCKYAHMDKANSFEALSFSLSTEPHTEQTFKNGDRIAVEIGNKEFAYYFVGITRDDMICVEARTRRNEFDHFSKFNKIYCELYEPEMNNPETDELKYKRLYELLLNLNGHCPPNAECKRIGDCIKCRDKYVRNKFKKENKNR